MRKFLTVGLVFFGASTMAFAEEQPTTNSVVTTSLESSIHQDSALAIAALEKGDFQSASLYFQTASSNANRLSLQSVAQKIQLKTPSFASNTPQFVLTNSSTIALAGLLQESNALESRFKDEDGNVVTVRLFSDDQALEDFMTISSDETILKKANIETAEMMGEAALKAKGEDNELSVLMMSEKDHALVEVSGDSDSAVMAFIKDLEDGE